MKSILIKIVVIIILVVSVLGTKKETNITINDENMELEEYLIHVVASEMPYSFHIEALKAQSVVSRTYALSRNLKLDNTTTTQVYKSTEELKEKYKDKYEEMYAKVKEAVNATKEEVLTYNNEYISALFYSCSNGYSNNAEDYFQNELPYLKSVQSKWDINCPAYKKEVVFNAVDFMQKLNISSISINNIIKYDNGYIKSIVIGEKCFSGREVRELLSLRSSCFEIRYDTSNVYITTYGYGHGVGMSQYGAQGMANEGYSYVEILNHYYQNVQLNKINE